MQYIPKFFKDLLDFSNIANGKYLKKKQDGSGIEGVDINISSNVNLAYNWFMS